MGVLYHYSKNNIFVSIGIHFLNNLIAVIGIFVLGGIGYWVESIVSLLKANKAMDKGDYENAILIYRDAFSQKATAGDLFNLGRAYIYVGEIDEAIDCFKVLDVIIPEEVVAKEMLVGLYLTKKTFRKQLNMDF